MHGCVCMCLFVCMYECMHTCIGSIPSHVLFFHVNLCICYCHFTGKKSSFGLEKPHGELMMAVLSLGRTIPSSIQVMLHCEASCEEYCCSNKTCSSLHCPPVCILLVTLVDVEPCSLLIVARFVLFHANKVMRKD
mgnify:CR=1 FL=1